MIHHGSSIIIIIIIRHPCGDSEKTKYLAINWIILLTRECEIVFIAIPSALVWRPTVQLLNKFTSHGLSNETDKHSNDRVVGCAKMIGALVHLSQNFLHYNPSRGLIPSLWLLRADCVYFVFFWLAENSFHYGKSCHWPLTAVHEFLPSTLLTYRVRLRYVSHFVFNVKVYIHCGAS